jgi:hypothetical protein
MLYELCSALPTTQPAFLWVSERPVLLIGATSQDRWIRGVWMLSLVPLHLWSFED